MQHAQEGKFEIFDASAYRVGIVVAQFNSDITEGLLASALTAAREYSVPDSSLTIMRVAGSIEIPHMLQVLAKSKKYTCLVALGAVIRGETPHFDIVAKMAAEGIMRVMLDHSIPIGFGVLTCDTKPQALARLQSGVGALIAALHSAKVAREGKI